MRIETDDEGRKIIQSLCGVVIESIGGRALPLVNTVLSYIKPVQPPQKKEPEKDDNPAEAQ